MILKIRNSVYGKGLSLLMVFVFLFTMNPNQSYALTGGPAQPEFGSFTPIGTSDMVDLSSGDFSYNIPLLDVGGFPINLAYNSGITMDDEASWVGLGWNLSIGQINRQMRGIPDDFDGSKGDKLTYENNIKDNYTVGASFAFTPTLAGVPSKEEGDTSLLPNPLSFTVGLSAQYNSYDGVSITPSVGVSFALAEQASVGLNVSSSPDGLNISPNISLHSKYKSKAKRDNNLGCSFGVSFNSRQGLTSMNMSASHSRVDKDSNGKSKTVDSQNIGSSISFAANHYTPSLNDEMVSENFTFNASGGFEFMAVEGNAQVTGFGSTQYLAHNTRIEKAFGYENTHKSSDNDVLDFNREKDGNFSVNSTNLAITNYTYDIYSVQGQGVGGMFRPYRSQIGFVHDNQSNTNGGGGALGLEFGVGNAAHTGVDVETTITSSVSGNWNENNTNIENFSSDTVPSSYLYEEVYFKNVGDLSTDEENPSIYGTSTTLLGEYSPITLKIGGAKYARTLSSIYLIKHPTSPLDSIPQTISDDIKRSQRLKRNQNIQKITRAEVTDGTDTLLSFRPNSHAKAHHTAGFIVTRNDGARYVYGEALYNTTKKEVSFAVGDEVGGVLGVFGSNGDCSTGLVDYSPGVDNSIDNQKGDHYYNSITTPDYAHTYLLTSLLSSDYSDVDPIKGPSEGDLGSYTLFEYNTPDDDYHWRIPYTKDKANFDEGLKTDPTDDKGSYVYGKKEIKYIRKIETKTHVALFYVYPRHDAYGVGAGDGENGSANFTATSSKMYLLDRIALFSKGEFTPTGYDSHGNITTSSTPIKMVHLEYDYSLCKNVPNNDHNTTDYNSDGVADNNNGGKLTLKKVYFTYRNSNMGKYSAYNFEYNGANPEYNLKGYDIWGNYKYNPTTQNCDILDTISAPEFNYVDQDSADTDTNSYAWTLTDIKLPSGGKIEVDYEADDYQFVQNKKTMRMFKVVGAGEEINPIDPLSSTYVFTPNDPDNALLFKSGENHNEISRYLYIKLPEEDAGISETNFQEKYLSDIVSNQQSLIQFRFLVNMNHVGGKTDNWEDGGYFDYVSGYFKLDGSSTEIFSHVGSTYASIKMQLVPQQDGLIMVNPISKSGWQFGRKYLPKYIYGLPEQNENDEPHVLLETILQAASNLKETLLGANGYLKSEEIARRFIPEKSWIRLSNPNSFKKGGGCRVSQIAMTDEWDEMTKNEEMSSVPDITRKQKYGQQYRYVLEDLYGNVTSSGVAAYEPVGSKENPFVQPVFVNEARLLAPDEENYMEKPFGESFFPSPVVTYSRVEVKNLERVDGTKIVQKHATGKVVTEFYTSKDYPTITDQTKLYVEEDKNPLLHNLLKVDVKKHITLSQGYVIHINDMNGKMKSQRVYGEDQTAFISGVDYIYDGNSAINPDSLGANPFALVVHNDGKINNKVRALFPNGEISEQTLGVEFDVINDFREMRSSTTVSGVNTNAAAFFVGAIPGFIPVPLPDYAHHEDKLNMSVTTKVINTFGVQREVIAYDAGAAVYTRNLIWDASTGEVLLTETVNEYGDKYYSLNFPAHWYYDGMGMACKNSGAVVSVTGTSPNFSLANSTPPDEIFANGDEILVNPGVSSKIYWITDVTSTDFNIIDKNGNSPLLSAPFKAKIVRSGRRNIQSTQMASIVTMKNPVNGISQLPSAFLESADTTHRIINAGAVEFSDDWALQCECGIDDSVNTYNPYRFNTKGVWRALRSHLYLAGRYQSAGNIDPRNSGFYTSFAPFYQVNSTTGVWSIEPAAWTFTSKVTLFSPYGFELENEDALHRYSAAQYGYNFSFPMAVGANTRYSQIGYDGFEDYYFDGCPEKEHFGFRDGITASESSVTNTKSHTGGHSLKLEGGEQIQRLYIIDCNEDDGDYEIDPELPVE